MQEQSINELSKKTRGILFEMKKYMKDKKIDLFQLVYNKFGLLKQNFDRKDFHLLMRTYNQNQRLDDIDQVFIQIDVSSNECININDLLRNLQMINEDDNLKSSLDRKIKQTINLDQKKKLQMLLKLKNALVKNEEYIMIIDLFDTERLGYFTKANFQQLMNNLQITDSNEKKIITDKIFEGKQKIKIQQMLKKIGLEDSISVNLSKLDISLNKPKAIVESEKSLFIQKHSFIKQQHTIKKQDSQKIIEIQNIPLSLKPYYNYGSQMELSFADIASHYIQSNSIFIDPEGPFYSMASRWVHFSETGDYQLFQKAKSVIHRKERKGLGQLLQTKDVKQGSVGDCYFLAAVAAIVDRYPELVYQLFVLEKNPSHIYGVRLFIDGMWKTVVLDACFPYNGHFLGAQPHHNQIWVMLLQKAWAKCYLSYDNIIAGHTVERLTNIFGLNALTGAPCLRLLTEQPGILQKLEVELNKGALLTCSTQTLQLTPEQQQALGIFAYHAYTLINIYPDLPVGNKSVKLVKIRNPWGRTEWKGDWGYNSKLWTNQLRQILSYDHNPKDGTFFMSFDDFTRYFVHVVVSKVNLAYVNSWIQIKENRFDYTHTTFYVPQKGDYFFTIYQDNPRKYKNSFVYKKSKSVIYLGKIKDGKIYAIGSRTQTSGSTQNILQATLDQGQYVIISKVVWLHWQQHTYRITSYGPSKLILTNKKMNVNKSFSQFIQSKSHSSIVQIQEYKNTQVYRSHYFSPEQGYGFISITNASRTPMKVNIDILYSRGIKALFPHSLPLKLYVFPDQNVVAKFLVDPTGYRQYQLREYYEPQ